MRKLKLYESLQLTTVIIIVERKMVGLIRFSLDLLILVWVIKKLL